MLWTALEKFAKSAGLSITPDETREEVMKMIYVNEQGLTDLYTSEEFIRDMMNLIDAIHQHEYSRYSIFDVSVFTEQLLTCIGQYVFMNLDRVSFIRGVAKRLHWVRSVTMDPRVDLLFERLRVVITGEDFVYRPVPIFEDEQLPYQGSVFFDRVDIVSSIEQKGDFDPSKADPDVKLKWNRSTEMKKLLMDIVFAPKVERPGEVANHWDDPKETAPQADKTAEQPANKNPKHKKFIISQRRR